MTAGAASVVEGRRARRKREIRIAVREAALRLALRDGVEHVTVEQIATEADIAVRTFFNHFASREEAMVAVVAAWAEAFVAEVRGRPAGEPVFTAIREAVLAVMDTGVASHREHVAALRMVREAPSLLAPQLAVLAAQERALAAAIAERVGDGSDTDAGLCAVVALAALRCALDRWLDGAGERPEDEEPSAGALRREVDRALTQVADGFDRRCAPEPRGQAGVSAVRMTRS